MKFTIQREVLLAQLQKVVGVVAKKSTMPILSNVVVSVSDSSVSITGTDTEVEVTANANVESADIIGETTIPARKLFDIVRCLPSGCIVRVSVDSARATVTSGRSRFTLSTLPANEYPYTGDVEVLDKVTILESGLLSIISSTAFAMAQNDVRYYLNGLLFDFNGDRLTCVGTDGHRLAMCDTEVVRETQDKRQLILPRKGVLELQRMLEDGESTIELQVGNNSLRVVKNDVTFTSKLIDGKFPDYNAVVPVGADKEVNVNRDVFKSALQRASILSNEKYRGVMLTFGNGSIGIKAHNVEQEEAHEEIDADTSIEPLSIGFNVTYILDSLNSMECDDVVLYLRDSGSSALICDGSNSSSKHVVMPLRM